MLTIQQKNDIAKHKRFDNKFFIEVYENKKISTHLPRLFFNYFNIGERLEIQWPTSTESYEINPKNINFTIFSIDGVQLHSGHIINSHIMKIFVGDSFKLNIRTHITLC
jgi:hypothetical protein